MEAYTDFAAVYDTFMDDTPYDVWGDFVAGLIERYGISKPVESDKGKAMAPAESEETDLEEALTQEKNLVVELGCGTGSFTRVLKKKGFDIIGMDLSPEMLNIARNKASEEKLDIMFIEQDMRELDLYCTAGTIVSVCDSINYILDDEEIVETFRLVNNFLFPGGVLIFDFNTLHKYRDVIGDATIAENREDCSFIWDNYFHEDEGINEYDLTVFVSCDEEKDLFKKFTETHFQRGYTLEEMKSFIERSGLLFVDAIDADTHDEPTDESERIYVIAREQGKTACL